MKALSGDVHAQTCSHRLQPHCPPAFFARRPLRASAQQPRASSGASQVLKTRQKQICGNWGVQHKEHNTIRCRAAAEAPESEQVEDEEEGPQFPLHLEWQWLPRSRLRCKVEVPQELVARFWDEILKELRKRYKNIPGYRPQDPVPEHLIVNEHGGLDKFKYTVIEAILETTVGEALKKHAEEMIQDSDRFEEPIEKLFERFDKNQPFSYSISADVWPNLTWKGPYDGLKLEVDAVAEASPEEEVEHQIQLSRRAKGRTNVVQGRGLQQGDLCMVKFEARHLDSDTIMPRTAHERMQIDSNIPEQIPMPGLVEAMLGLQPNETREFVLAVPPGWGDIAEGASEAKIVVTLRELLEYIDLPEVTDDWVEATWPGQGSLANLKNNLLQAVQQRARHETQDKVRMAITHALSELVDVDIPDSMIEDVAKNEFQAKLFEVGQKLGVEQMKALTNENAYRKYIETRREDLELMQKAIMAVDFIFKEQKLSVSETALIEEVNEALDEARQSGQELDVERLKEQAFELLKAQTVHDWVQARSDVTVLPPAKRTPAASATAASPAQ